MPLSSLNLPELLQVIFIICFISFFQNQLIKYFLEKRLITSFKRKVPVKIKGVKCILIPIPDEIQDEEEFALSVNFQIRSEYEE